MIIGTAREAADLFAPLFAEADREMVAVLHLNGGRRLLALDRQDVAQEAEAELPLRSIIARALELDSRSLIVAHNHPSGDCRPSPADIAATRRLAETAASLNIRLHDHLIFAGADCRSFRELGLL